MPLRALILAAALAVPAVAPAQDVAGPYLAARIAGFENDYAAAARQYERLLRRDNIPAAVLENAVIVFGALGRFDEAAEAAQRMVLAGQPSSFGSGVELVVALRDGDWDRADELLSDGNGVGGALLDGLLRGWIAAARGDVEGAGAAFDAVAETDSFAIIVNTMRAFLLAMDGQFGVADDILSGRAAGVLNLNARGIEAHAQVLMELGRRDDALELLRLANAETNSPTLQALERRIEDGDAVSFDLIETPRDGMAEAFFVISAILSGETSPTFALVNAQAVVALRPEHVEGLVLVATLLESQDQHALANDTLQRVPADDPAYDAAEIARAEVLLNSERDEAAVEVLQGITRKRPDDFTAWTALGDTLRRLERFPVAADAYTRAIDLRPEIEARDWFLYYARGIAHEQMDRFDLAEPDFRRALELNPDQPLVLNYLGYSLVEARKNLDEALGMIERAVTAQPDSGYIVDSLGWAFYRLDRFEDAVEPMERAAELLARDPLVNDHLGDVYWKVGRQREARFQWRRALSLEPEADVVERIRRKLDVGLDVVLDAEADTGDAAAAQ